MISRCCGIGGEGGAESSQGVGLGGSEDRACVVLHIYVLKHPPAVQKLDFYLVFPDRWLVY